MFHLLAYISSDLWNIMLQSVLKYEIIIKYDMIKLILIYPVECKEGY